ncbi:hypothetical protein K490DRAFT_72495 [Saccharata proteae CBS 121410]|uniref:Uncharacterized protein n=1 Tax=Saccharata proteae CBS 121410 TaxID=1314787 RepID=A0A6A5YBU6_9PEZI|nr:hypothetical protein K490DRAFT_72495 [Saccharata proteae CBS 121410]
MPIRNPFKRTGGVDVQDENSRPIPRSGADRGFQRADAVGSTPVDIKEPAEYKLSEINDSGVYLPPSPPERKGFWQTKSSNSVRSANSNHRQLLSENEPFSISRESFESYRRSFDISARSPVIPELDSRGRASMDCRPRQSLDSRQARLPRSSLNERRLDRPAIPVEDSGFEDVGLNDEPKPQKKKGIFSRFGDSADPPASSSPTDGSRPNSHHGFLFPGRKRGQSGQGAELSPMGRPASTHSPAEVSVESQ